MSQTPRPSMLAPFAIRSYRFQWPADLATSWAFEMETLILGWFILVETGSVLLLTLFASLQFGGTLIAPAFGLAGDRIGHRNVIVLMRLLYALLAVVLTVVILSDGLTPVLALVVAGIAGMVRPSDMNVRNVIIGETMPADRLMSAVGLSRITTDSARVAGAIAGAGMVAAVGMGQAYIVVVLLYLLGALLTLGVAKRSVEAASAARAQPFAPLQGLRDAARAVWEAPPQLAAMVLAVLVNLAVFPFTIGLLPYVAREVYGATQADLGYMAAAVGIGAIAASLIVSRMGTSVRAARMMVIFCFVWHAMVIAFGHTTSLEAGLILLVLTGLAQGLCTLPMSVLLLRGAPPALRGRIMGMRTLAIYGLPVGLLVAGPLIERIGFAGTATLYGGLGAACTLAVLLYWWSDLWPKHAPSNGG
ncbi:MFS transporter [Roseococcus pinisoli]